MKEGRGWCVWVHAVVHGVQCVYTAVSLLPTPQRLYVTTHNELMH